MTEPPPDAAPTPGGGGVGSRGRAVGRGLRSGAVAAGRGAAGAARATGRFGAYAGRQARRAARAEGAGESGLSRLIELHACNAAGDTAVAISLATTVFFAGATSEARSQVALFLALTMLPFAIVAPLIGPFLDRFSHGRRWAIGATFAIRAFLCWVLAGAVAEQSALLYPAALGVLVSSKAYGVTRAAAVPRLLPETFTLVKANGRVSLAGMVGAGVAAPLAGGAVAIAPEWGLRVGFLIFVLGTIAAIRLPDKVDSSAGEEAMTIGGDEPARTGRRGTRIPREVAFALRANCGPRWLSGFLVMFLAFLLRDNPIEGWEDKPELLVAVVIGAAGVGNGLAVLVAALAKRVDPAITLVVLLLADAAMVILTAVFYGFVTLVALGLTAGLAQSLAKLSLDATIQDGVPRHVQASAFARSDTTVQLAWVIGGFVGIAMPLIPRLGLSVAGVVLVAWTVFAVGTRRTPAGSPPTPTPG